MTHLSRRTFIKGSLLLGTGLSSWLQAQSPDTHLPIEGGNSVHDPVLIKEDDTYYLFCTGPGVSVRTSKDLMTWENPASVFAKPPAWVAETIPNQNDFWAPDIAFYNGKYHLYYSVSTFGKNTSVIGLATNKTLNPESADFAWNDEGLVIASKINNIYNCIDPNLILDAQGQPWLSFGSFWSGIMMRRLDLTTGKLSTEDTKLYSLARRGVSPNAIEAPFMIYRDGYYYLFVSFDFCCRGSSSTYHVRVGRSEKVSGTFVDREGVSLLEDGGTQVTFESERFKGPGHNAIFQENNTDYVVYHAYDAENGGTPQLRIAPLVWEGGWPYI